MQRILLSLVLVSAASPALTAADFADDFNRLSLGPRFGLNFKANFSQSGAYRTPGVNPGLAAGGVDHQYDNGYVRVDSTGNAGGVTWNWGYQNAAQAGGATLQFDAIQANRGASTSDNPQFGAELIYQRVIGSLPVAMPGRWGLETGFGYTDLDLRNQRAGAVAVTTDSYALVPGVVLPPPPYNGSFAGPGPLIGATPVRTTTLATQSGYQQLSGSMFSLRVGPFVECNVLPELSLSASAGLTLAPTSADYDYAEIVTLPSGVNYTASGHSSKTKLLCGPYVGGMVRYDFNREWGIYAGAQFQSLTSLAQAGGGGRTARLDPGTTVYLTLGVTWKF